MTLTAVVTGASSGIGAATARALAEAGYRVVCAARRTDRIEPLAAEIGGVAVACDITDPAQVDALAAAVGDRLDLLVNNAGGAVGTETLAEADFDAWVTMFETNVLGAGRVTKALLPALRAAEGTVVFVTSTAAEAAYEGGSGYNAAKAGERMLAGALRLELNGEPVRVCEVAPGLVHTEEFSLVRFHGDQAKADAVYAGVPDPLVAEDVAEVITWVATRPPHVNIDRLVVRPRAQAANHKLFRG
ncbi:SDR family NAD(P)-dependent oxidoreductase [Propioniciclava sp. MC1595]|uniref:SDR family NAD(P)-dependent oxidoreductase n=1 Tax=Propioniciclava sp. MC1595 TaxID=2760308 RepID=UPI0016624017|nr:SDR family NAD(P)-dependent oxidoreductase [Propioniciclava sp. MC1595]MBB1494955.1 SDR family NAD(P)-dependent oxidoreductase [Propioniciclava sp. MC1595]QTE25574.1 SDR family NAD(P)-dependent oxidoreductase [Propioniciclava sp. MC1595]